MTQSLNALFSPETNPHPAELHPFSLLCDALFFYTLPGETEAQGCMTGYTPVHLADEEQARFQSLARELKGHEAEFHGGLLASLSAGQGDRDEASAGSLASSLRSGQSPAATPETTGEALWKAMLLLKLAEMFREEEREIAQGFLAISGKEAELFAAIRGEETGDEGEDEEEEAQALRELAAATTPGGPAINLTRLAKAWGHLYLRDAKAAEFPLLVTTQAELQGVLAEAYETLAGRPPIQLVSLTLPAQRANAEDGTLAEQFKSATGAARGNFNRLLLEIAASGTLSAGRLEELQGAGNELNRATLPFLKDCPTEKTLRFYAYEGASLVELFAGFCNETRTATAKATGLLAVLS
ncbi:MAG: hypothetical protein ACYC0O_10185 [Desulfurivibrionaceae bacterium]|nr:hypothetical protein [Desulfurivibrionaceae bacterium]PKN22479.1 MAG: hypothetical protein CVU68_04145 [Deltaproteobacteria bacterium HGW-Deltaproteobacteria-3]